MVRDMGKTAEKKQIVLAHPLREQLAEVVLGLPNFELAPESESLILANRKAWQAEGVSGPSLLRGIVESVIRWLRYYVGVLNVRRFTAVNGDLAFANGGFLVTNMPYVTYIEKSTQIYGYTARHYGKPWTKWLLKRFLRDPHLKKIFFRTEAAYEGMVAIPAFKGEIRELIRQKGMPVYPPLENPGKSDLKRFHAPEVVKFLFVSSLFYEKGGRELIRAFDRLTKDVDAVELHLIIKQERVQEADLSLIRANPRIVVHEAKLTRQELFDQFFNTCHVFVYPTYSDSFSAVINEAIAADLPIITSDFFAIPERVIDGENGLLFASPYKNYTQDRVITEEHFTQGATFPAKLFEDQAHERLADIESFLYDAMRQLAINSRKLEAMSRAARAMYAAKLDAAKIRQKINQAFLDAVK